MAQAIRNTFKSAKKAGYLSLILGRPVFVAYVTAGFPTREDTIPALLGLQQGGADVIELGVPFSDPIADGPTIQESNFIAIQNNISLLDCLDYVRNARAQGLKVPVLLMGYFNPFLSYGDSKLMKDCSESGVNGFICVDLPPEEAVKFRDGCVQYGLSYVPLITPSTSESRMKKLVTIASSFIYVVSTLGVTGARECVDSDLPALVERIKKHTELPLAVGFGVSTRAHFLHVGAHADGVVIGSKIITTLKSAPENQRAKAVKEFSQLVTGRLENDLLNLSEVAESLPEVPSQVEKSSHILPSRFGDFGGQYAPEALVDCLEEIEAAFQKAIVDESFKAELESHFPYTNRPSNLHLAEQLTKECGGARIWLKREDLNHVFY